MTIEDQLNDIKKCLARLEAKSGTSVSLVGKKVLYEGNIYTVDRDEELLTLNGGGYHILLVCHNEVQLLLDGPFDASRIPKSKVPGYKVWLDRGNSKYYTWVNESSFGWVSIESLDINDKDEIVEKIANGYWHFHDGLCAEDNPDGARLYWQPPEKKKEQPKVKEFSVKEPTDENCLEAIKRWPWLPRWCEDGIAWNEMNSLCPHGDVDDCPMEESVCYKLFGTYKDNRIGDCSLCPCNHPQVGIKKVRSVKDRIINLAKKQRTYRVGDVFRTAENLIIITRNNDEFYFTNLNYGKWNDKSVTNQKDITLENLSNRPSNLAYLGHWSDDALDISKLKKD
jgi:copper chaperone CopZ